MEVSYVTAFLCRYKENNLAPCAVFLRVFFGIAADATSGGTRLPSNGLQKALQSLSRCFIL